MSNVQLKKKLRGNNKSKMIKKVIEKLAQLIRNFISLVQGPANETAILAIGAMLSKQQFSINSENINDYEFKIFSQFGDDGIIQYLIKHIEIKNEIFIEFGVEDYQESNTRFLMMNNNWSGFVIDGSKKAMDKLKKRNWYWQYNLTNKTAFIDKENINGLLASTGFENIGLLHIDLDGNDYHILKEIDLIKLNPSIIIMEYNSVFGKERFITVPYKNDFVRTKAHFSNLFYGASLPALNHVAMEKGYSLIGSNLVGNNAYFVRKDLLNEKVKQVSIEQAYKESKFRESRDKSNFLSYINAEKRLELIKGLEVLNVQTNKLEPL